MIGWVGRKRDFSMLIKSGLGDRRPIDNLLGTEPEINLALGALGGIASMDQVAAHIDSIVSADGSRSALQRVSGTNQNPSHGDHTLSLPDHCADRARCDERDEPSEERAGLVLFIMSLSERARREDELHRNELIAFALESTDHFSNKISLNTVRLHCDETPFSGHEKKQKRF